jgi:uncharacterized protein DUF6893
VKEIRISPAMQLLGLLGLLGLIAAAVAAQAPEIKRYLNVRSMS